MRGIDTKHTLLAVAVATLLSAGCAEEGSEVAEQPGSGQSDGAQADGEGIDVNEQPESGQAGSSQSSGAQAGGEGIDVNEQSAGQTSSGQSASAYPPFEELDTNADGSLDRTEFASIEGLDFETVDENQDGMVSRDEYRMAQPSE